MSSVKYPGIKHEVIEQLQEALKKDYSDHIKNLSGFKQEESAMKTVPEMRGNWGLSAIKNENADEEMMDIKNY